MNCSVCCTILSCGSFPELSRSKSLTSKFVSWTWSTLSRCICRILSMILDSSGISWGTIDIPLACRLKATGEDCLFSWVEVANAANNSLSFASDATDCFPRSSIWAINPRSNPLTEPSHQTQFATKICWVLLACAIIFSRAYTITALLFSKVIVIQSNKPNKVRGCHYTKLIDSRYRYNRYRYHKNAIINKGSSSLVGIRFFVSQAGCLLHRQNKRVLL